MGRKPNPLLSHYFERGAKLNDSSNRYEHTCRACGERFPKGRIDNLTAHLVKKCPALTTAERQKVLLDLNNLPALAADAQRHGGSGGVAGGGGAGEGALLRDAHGGGGVPSLGGELTVGGGLVQNQWSPLRTLAEFAERSEQKKNGHDASTGDEGLPPAKKPRLALQEQYTLENPPLSYEQRGGTQRKVSLSMDHPDMAAFAVQMTNAQQSSSPSSPPNFAMAAAAAAASASVRHMPSMLDPSLDPELYGRQDSNSKQTEEQQQEGMAALLLSESIQPHGNWQDDASLEMSKYTDVDKVNALASHERMRSPSFHELPEQTLQQSSLPTGQPTISQRVLHEFTTEYGNGEKSLRPKLRSKFTDARRREVQEVRKQGACIRCRMLRKPCSKADGDKACLTCKAVESARLWKDTCRRDRVDQKLEIFNAGLHIVLASTGVNRIKTQADFKPSVTEIHAFHYDESTSVAFKSLEIHGSLGDNNQVLPPYESTSAVRLLDGEHDDLPAKVEAYMKRMCYVFTQHEPSPFMHTVLATAHRLAVESSDRLLEQAIEFWCLVHMLVDADVDWQIGEEGFVYNNSTPNHKVLRDQINAAVERKVERMAKTVLPNLERRLMKQPAHLKFETYLIALVVFNCVEKAVWLFTCWEQLSLTPIWPLENHPQYFTAQGEDLISLLELYLSLRSVQPKTHVRLEDGIVICDEGPVVSEFFEKIKITPQQLIEAQAKVVPDILNSRSYELRYCSRILMNPNDLSSAVQQLQSLEAQP